MKKLIIIIVFLISIFTLNITYAVEPEILGPDIIYKEADNIVTIDDIILLYQSPNRFITASEDGYTGNGAKIGTYSIVLDADSGLSIISREIQVKVVREIGNVMLVSNTGDIYVRPDQQLNQNDIRKVLSNVGIIQVPAGTGEQLISDSYTNNKTEPGKYNYKFKLLYTSGYVNEVDIDIYVVDGFTNIDKTEIINPSSSFDFGWIGKLFIDILIFSVLGVGGFIIYKFIFRKKKVI